MDFRLNTLLARLLIGSAIPLVLFVGVAVVASVVILRLVGGLNLEKHTHEVITEALFQRQRAERMAHAVRADPAQHQVTVLAGYDDNRRAFREAGEAMLSRMSDNAAQRRRLGDALATEAEWHRLVRDGLEGRLTTPQQTQEFVRRSDELSRRLGEQLDAFVGAEEELLALRRAQTDRQGWQAVAAIAAAAGLALVLSLLLALHSARGVTRPVDRLREAETELLAGRFRSVPPEGPTEIAQLIVHFNHMALTLTQQAGLLQRQEQRYRSYVGSVAQILWTTDAGGEVVNDLPSWRAFTGQSEEAVRGRGWLEAVHPDDRPAVEKAWRAAVRDLNVYEVEYRLRSHKGDYRHFACRGVPVMTSGGAVVEWVGTCTDVTDRKREAGLRRAKEAAEAKSRAKSEFLAKMSHELRTPLNAVIGMSKMLTTQRYGPLTDKQADYLGDITQAGEHLLALINDILDLAKVEAGKLDMQAETVPLSEAVRVPLSTLRPLAEAKGVALAFAPPADGSLCTDPDRFRQVLYNLLSNAVKFTPAGGGVTVACQWVASASPDAAAADERSAGAVRVAVRDTGVGIAKEEQAAVWDEFRQLKASPAAGGQQGTGLGLALTRRLVYLLGGDVWLESEPGRGSTFTFVIPRRLPRRGGSSDERRAAAGPDRPLALVVEDHPPTHKLLCDWLTEAGLATASAYDGEAALAQARALRPDLIVLDVYLPKRDGWQVLAGLKADPATASVPVAMVTVTEDRRPASALGVQEYFVKPVDREDFLRRLRGHLKALGLIQ